ncbi:MAG TPA: hypothetical protein DEB24_02065, partial [Coriobacteriia bacterium]|nr:hypothetical protein [Coriobacteriia bacterium]
MDYRDLIELLPAVARDANKYSRGSLLILAGSVRYPGAAILAAKAAERAGAGCITLAVPKSAVPVAQGHLLSVPVVAAPENAGAFASDAWFALSTEISHIDAVVLGPGLTDTASTREFALKVLRECRVPVLIDADGLNGIAASGFFGIKLDERHVLTPHAGELGRLEKAAGVIGAQELAVKTGATIVAKGPETHIVSPKRHVVSTAGTSALATAG